MKKVLNNNLFALKYAWKYGKVFCVMSFFSVIIGVFGDYVGMNISKWIFGGIGKRNVKEICIFLGIIILISLATNIVQGIFLNYKVQFEKIDVLYSMTEDLLNASFNIDQIKMEDPKFYDVFMRALSESRERVSEIVMSLRAFLYGVLSLSMVIYLAANIDIKITLSLLLASTIGTLVSYITNQLEYTRYMENSKNERKLSYIIRLIYQPEYARTIRLEKRGLCQVLKEELADNKRQVKDNVKKFYNKFFTLGVVSEITECILLRIIPWGACVIKLYTNQVTIAQASVILAAVSILPGVYGTVFGALISFNKNAMYIDNFKKVMRKSKLENKHGKTFLPNKYIEQINLIELSNVSFMYLGGGKEYALLCVNLLIEKGNTIALVGETGAGKTTLAMIIAGLYKAQEGQVLLNDINQNKIEKDELRKRVVYMGQDTKLYHFSVAQNILMKIPQCREDYEQVEKALKRVGLYEKVMQSVYQMDSNISTEFDEMGIEFSSGEKQKIFLARLYVSQAECMILDEPTCNLDPVSELEILQLMKNMFVDRTVIVISHRLALVKDVDKIIYMRQGKIEEEGTHCELIDKHKGYYYMYKAQADLYQ